MRGWGDVPSEPPLSCGTDEFPEQTGRDSPASCLLSFSFSSGHRAATFLCLPRPPALGVSPHHGTVPGWEEQKGTPTSSGVLIPALNG